MQQSGSFENGVEGEHEKNVRPRNQEKGERRNGQTRNWGGRKGICYHEGGARMWGKAKNEQRGGTPTGDRAFQILGKLSSYIGRGVGAKAKKAKGRND